MQLSVIFAGLPFPVTKSQSNTKPLNISSGNDQGKSAKVLIFWVNIFVIGRAEK